MLKCFTALKNGTRAVGHSTADLTRCPISQLISYQARSLSTSPLHSEPTASQPASTRRNSRSEAFTHSSHSKTIAGDNFSKNIHPRKLKSTSMQRPSAAPPRGTRGRPPFRGGNSTPRKAAPKTRGPPPPPTLEGPLYDEAYITATHNPNGLPLLKPSALENPKSPFFNYVMTTTDKSPNFEASEGLVKSSKVWRVRVLADEPLQLYGIGDAPLRKDAEKLAALSACLQLAALGLLDRPKKSSSEASVVLSDGTEVQYERARTFLDYYCRRFGFDKPELELHGKPSSNNWEASMHISGRRIGLGSGTSKKTAQIQCYLDVCKYLETCDPKLWADFVQAVKAKEINAGPNVYLKMSPWLDEEIHQLCSNIQESTLYENRPPKLGKSTGPGTSSNATSTEPGRARAAPTEAFHQAKSERLLSSLQAYESNPLLETMRATRASLPVATRSEELLKQINEHDVSICMATTGSGKTTQIPQIILDDWIRQGKGSRCNIICTQPRRIAAISVAQRVAKERGEEVGNSIGYQVRFEAKLPQEHGGVTFCTTGLFLKRMQSALQDAEGSHRRMDDVTHIIVDEVHERDVDTDLVLVVLKRLLEDRRARGIPLKIVLMSATIDPTLFQRYFAAADGTSAKVVDIPGRSFPVDKMFLEDVIDSLGSSPESAWVFKEKSVSEYVSRELGPAALLKLGAPPPLSRTASSASMAESFSSSSDDTHDLLEMPHPLIALTIAQVLSRSDSGHVLVFLPGWDEITSVQKLLQDRTRSLLGVNFSDPTKHSIHVLHSTVPVAEQQAVFEPAGEGVRRIILATNIAETSITIPDVVYVVDAAKVKEIRYDPQKHMSSLVSAWVGKSNLNQRAGRAGRHRPGEYFGIISKARAETLDTHQTVEMKRSDLSNVVMHVKGLDFPGMEVEEVLAALIEPPAVDRVRAAIANLKMVGALDEQQNLTSLGRVLQQLPLDVNMGRLVLFGSFFKCLDQALTLVAILSNRDPFMSPMALKKEANAAKERWTPPDFRSDTLATLFAYNEWARLEEYNPNGASRFCIDNFLSKTTLQSIHKIRTHVLQALDQAGVLHVSGGGQAVYKPRMRRKIAVPDALNEQGGSLPMLAALIAIGSQPNFAIKTSTYSYRTSQDNSTFIHPSSVNHRKRELIEQKGYKGEKQLFTFQEKTRNVSSLNTKPMTYLRNCTRLDPMTYLLFGAYRLEITEHGLDCDGWLPVQGEVDVLDDVQRLKTLMDTCMLRVFEGICHWRKTHDRDDSKEARSASFREEESGDDEPELGEGAPAAKETASIRRETPLSPQEIHELDMLTKGVVNVLDRYADERTFNQSRANSRSVTPAHSRPATPSASRPGTPGGGSSPTMNNSLRLPSMFSSNRGFSSLSGYSTPLHGSTTPYLHSAFNSRPATPSGLGGHGRNSYFNS